ncbi:MAG: lamin tail domain-containing protein, partial [Candidatus Levybacteria bacterium]|nr:lamin tail domain-containing protein [Candidatus Levybacteria bacterium]
INEVYYDPDSAHTVGGPDGDNNSEWIELYNPTGSTINVKDWKVTDNSGTERTVSTSNRNIGPGEFAMLAKAANVRTLWSVDESQFIAIGEIFGNGLANTGDRVILKDNLGNIIDQMSYGTDTTVLSPSASDVSDGHSLERDPDGLDTNTAADFVDRTTPTPGT